MSSNINFYPEHPNPQQPAPNFQHFWYQNDVTLNEAVTQTFSQKLKLFQHTNNHLKNPPKRSNRPTKRTTFTPEQVTMLEIEFAKNEYICKDRRNELARLIDLSECQVKTWFQNRRTKKRRCQSPTRKCYNKEEEYQVDECPATPNPGLQLLFQGWNPAYQYPPMKKEKVQNINPHS